MEQRFDSDSEIRVLSPTGILGYGFPVESFERGMRRKPHLIAVDGGSTDPGPYYLGAGTSFTTRTAVKRDLQLMLRAAISNGIPLVVGSCGGAGASPHLQWCRDIVLEVARQERLHFRLGTIDADVDRELVARALERGAIRPLPSVPPLTHEILKDTRRIVAQMGTEPICAALQAGCAVVLCGRAYDPAIFAASALLRGYDRGLALHMGKILECAAIAAEPGSGADCCLGTLRHDGFLLESLNPARRFTSRSVAAHTLYEKADPYLLQGPGGCLDLRHTKFQQLGDGTVRVSGSRFEPSSPYTVKLEGVRMAGYRTICIAGCRDPNMIAHIDEIIAAARSEAAHILGEKDLEGRLNVRVYGKNGVMGALEPLRSSIAHELGLLIEAVGSTQEHASTICAATRAVLLHYGYPGRVSTAGNLALPLSPSDVNMGEVYEFSIFHLMEIENQDLFGLQTVEV